MLGERDTKPYSRVFFALVCDTLSDLGDGTWGGPVLWNSVCFVYGIEGVYKDSKLEMHGMSQGFSSQV